LGGNPWSKGIRRNLFPPLSVLPLAITGGATCSKVLTFRRTWKW
jgi:hypothetical protein